MDECSGSRSKSPYSSDDENATKARERNTQLLLHATAKVGNYVRNETEKARGHTFYGEGPCVMHLKASSITKSHIEEYFPNVEFVCPSNIHPGDDLDGATESHILQHLLTDMKTKRFPMSSDTPEDIQSAIIETHQNVKNGIEPLLKCLESVSYDGSTVNSVRAAYGKLLGEVQRHATPELSGTTSIKILHNLEFFLEASLNSAKDKDPHAFLVTFWRSVLALYEGPHPDTSDVKKMIQLYMRANGDGPKTSVHLHVDRPEGGHKKIKKVALDHCDLKDTPGHADGNKMFLTIHCKPDAVVYARESIHMESGDVDLKAENCKFIIEGKTSKRAVGTIKDACKYRVVSSPDGAVVSPVTCASPTSSTYEHDPDYKTSDHQALDFSQLLIELLGAMRQYPGPTHMIGLYCVMHRVYITCLHVEGSESSSAGRRAMFIGTLNFDEYEHTLLQAGKKPKKRLYFRLVCTKPFNILIPVQLKALLQYIQYLLFKKEEDF